MTSRASPTSKTATLPCRSTKRGTDKTLQWGEAEVSLQKDGDGKVVVHQSTYQHESGKIIIEPVV